MVGQVSDSLSTSLTSAGYLVRPAVNPSVDAFTPSGPAQVLVATTSNQSQALNGTGDSILIANEGSVAANEHIDVKTGVGAQDASTGTVRRIYAGTFGTLPCEPGDNTYAVKAVTGTPTVRVMRGKGTL